MTTPPLKLHAGIAAIKDAALRRGGVPALAKWLGVRVRPGDRVAHCPNGDGHAHGDRNPSLQLHADGFKCHGCGKHGDALDLVVLAEGCDLAEARRVVASFAGVPYAPPIRPRSPSCLPVGRAPAVGLRQKPRPPRVEVQALWNVSEPVDRAPVDPDQDLEVPLTKRTDGPASRRACAEMWPHFYLIDRRLYAPALARLDVIRITPLRPPWPTWPTWWPASWAMHYRLVVRAFEPDGTLASLHARAVPAYDPDGRPLEGPSPKTRWPKDCAAAGLLFADPAGLTLLRGHQPHKIRDILVTEGLTDFASVSAWAADQRALGERVAVLGGTSGSFPALAKARWPGHARVHAAVDRDRAGEDYHAQIVGALRPLGIPVGRLDWTRAEASDG